MIVSFRDQGTRDIFDGANTKEARKSLPRDLWSIACRKLDMLNAAAAPVDLKVPPGNRLEAYEDGYSIRINDQYRITFKFAGGNASDVLITDYH
jgi:proteic killer suppression protein